MEHKFTVSVISDFDGRLVVTELYTLTPNQIAGHYELFVKRLIQGEIKGVTIELSNENAHVN